MSLLLLLLPLLRCELLCYYWCCYGVSCSWEFAAIVRFSFPSILSLCCIYCCIIMSSLIRLLLLLLVWALLFDCVCCCYHCYFCALLWCIMVYLQLFIFFFSKITFKIFLEYYGVTMMMMPMISNHHKTSLSCCLLW